jgi:hypothetical protein
MISNLSIVCLFIGNIHKKIIKNRAYLFLIFSQYMLLYFVGYLPFTLILIFKKNINLRIMGNFYSKDKKYGKKGAFTSLV